MHVSAEEAGDLATFFGGLAHPVRLRVVGLLLEGERSVSELVRALDVPQARVSRHLQTLRRCGCCTARQEGNWVYNQVRHPHLIGELLRLAGAGLQDGGGSARHRRH